MLRSVRSKACRTCLESQQAASMNSGNNHEAHEGHEDVHPSWLSCASWFNNNIIYAPCKANSQPGNKVLCTFIVNTINESLLDINIVFKKLQN